MGKSRYAIGRVRSKQSCAHDGGRGVNVLPFWCVCTK